MSKNFDWPVIVFSGDVDWASEACIEDFLAFAAEHRIKPFLFVTHESAAISSAVKAGRLEVGVHPNFLPGSSHGSDTETVIDTVLSLAPESRGFRSHYFVDSTQITRSFKARGLTWDSNLCVYLEDNLRPLRHCSGLTRFPTFWADDVHMSMSPGEWTVDTVMDRFLSPGLKVLDVHPIHLALNTPDPEFYNRHKGKTGSYTAAELESVRHKGPGVRTFLAELFRRLRGADVRSYTFSQLMEMSGQVEAPAGHSDKGRNDQLSGDDHTRYWNMTPEQRQAMLRDMYNQRNPTDPYSTSRDHNQRELEITAIKASLGDHTGSIVDLGCGNGHTLLSIATDIAGSRMVGVDFADKLIEGARELTRERAGSLKSTPEFVCGDAIVHVKGLATGGTDCVITERFLLNLPDEATQHEVLREIHRALRPGGRLLMCEGSLEGFKGLNRLRTAMGLDEILETSAENVSSRRFDDVAIEKFVVDDVGFRLVDKMGFSTFFAISRALYPALISPQRPTFTARINELAREIQENLPWTPGLGSNVLWVLEKSQAA